eukprot:gene17893-biopygen8036
MIGIDTLTVTPVDSQGNQYLIVIVVLDSKLTALYPSAKHDARSVANALIQFFATYGVFDTIVTDPGSEFANALVAHLTKAFGVLHRFSLVDRHESNGVESHNRLILAHLRALVADERIRDNWSSPFVLPLVQFFLNSFDSSETGLTPFHAHFGSNDQTYFRMPDTLDPVARANTHLRLLDDNLRTLREVSHRYQADLLAERLRHNPPSDDVRNMYQPGDLVLFQQTPHKPLPDKLSSRFLGPYKVVSQTKNDVSCRSLIDGSVHVFHVTRLKLFFGSAEEAFRLAQLDADQHVIQAILAYDGNPEKRRDMRFLVHFADDSKHWLQWSKDISDTVQFEDFCRQRPELAILLLPAATASTHVKSLARSPITLVEPGDTVLVDIRAFGPTWYRGLDLPDLHTSSYLVELRYDRWTTPRRLRIDATCPLFREHYQVANDFVTFYGSLRRCPNYQLRQGEILVDLDFVLLHPHVLPDATRDQILKQS